VNNLTFFQVFSYKWVSGSKSKWQYEGRRLLFIKGEKKSSIIKDTSDFLFF